jgi:hypothetical protein
MNEILDKQSSLLSSIYDKTIHKHEGIEFGILTTKAIWYK